MARHEVGERVGLRNAIDYYDDGVSLISEQADKWVQKLVAAARVYLCSRCDGKDEFFHNGKLVSPCPECVEWRRIADGE